MKSRFFPVIILDELQEEDVDSFRMLAEEGGDTGGGNEKATASSSGGQQEEGGVLVHCQFGVSRSASFVIAYVMALHGWDFEEAFRFVGARRRAVASNLMMFRDQLKLWHRLQYRLPPSIPASAADKPTSSPSDSTGSSYEAVISSLTPLERKFLVRHPKNM